MVQLMKTGPEAILKAAEIIHAGGTVVVPTDTNYNVVTSPFSASGVERIFNMKKRESLSPLTLFLGDSMEYPRYAYTTPLAEYLAKRMWPGMISFVCWQQATVPHYVTRGFGTVACTLHSNTVHREIAHLVGTPLAGTSANLSGTGNVPDVRKAVEHLGEYVDLIIDAGVSSVDNANTIVDLTFDRPMLARDGAYPLEEVLRYLPDLIVDKTKDEYKALAKQRVGKPVVAG
ncbi:L-threonylcarbamoyladenylate synthase [Acidithiobacillus sp.]|jgi:L-threonylcarbamoyladenylate synthase|uniref:L-threonylcarbamoyladenylate synthase n=1 Tax=Acidithiobacillus sp. TaxID=1872118 RepID=UPI00356A0504